MSLVGMHQIQFINFAIIPSFSLLENLLPNSSLAVHLARENIRHWEEKKDATHLPAEVAYSNASLNHKERQHSRIAMFELIRCRSSTYWQVVAKMLRCSWWFCAFVCIAALDIMLTGQALFPKPNALVLEVYFHTFIGALRRIPNDAIGV